MLGVVILSALTVVLPIIVGIVCIAANMVFGAVSGSGTAAVAAIGKMEIAERAHATATLREHTAEFVAKFAEVAGDVDCVKV